jgi:hypothetical protein
MFTPFPHRPGLPDDQLLWRYLDFYKFADLLKSGTLYCRRADKLTAVDAKEGSMTNVANSFIDKMLSKELIREYRSARIPAISGVSINQGSALDTAKKLRAIARDHYRYCLERTYVCCWHTNNTEDALMWSSYVDRARSDGPGVAIQTTSAALRQSLNECPETIFTCPVDYIDHETHPFDHQAWVPGVASAVFDSLSKKQLPFSGEREFRLVVDEMPIAEKYDHLIPAKIDILKVNPVQELRLKVDLNMLIGSIVLPPKTGLSKKAQIFELLDGLPPDVSDLKARIRASILQ